jgi:flagellar biosynthesis/type III secretory pathway chaperone
MFTAPVVSLLETGKTFKKYTMICSRRDLLELMQEKRGITTNMQRVNLQEKDYITHELELVDIILALKKWRRYLYEAMGLSHVDCQKTRNGNLLL